MKFLLFLCAVLMVALCGAHHAAAQTSPISGQAISIATPTPAPVGTNSTALNTSITGGGPATGQGSMGTGVNTPATSFAPSIVPGSITINANANSLGTGNVPGSVQINNGGAGSVTGAPVPQSPIPTYVTPGSGLGTPATSSVTSINPNPGSVQ